MGGKKFLVVHVVEMAAIPTGTAVLAPPEGSASLLPGRIELPEDRLRVVSGLADASQALGLITRNGVLPDFAIELVIGKDGRMLGSTVVTAPAGSASIIAKAARKLVFEPFTLLGEPVEVTSTVHHRNNPSATDAPTVF